MKRTLLLLLIGTMSACVSADTSSFESRFAHERVALTCFEGPTWEESCGGTGLSVYLNGQQVRHLDWTIETSTEFIRRQYYFDGSEPRWVVETTYAKRDARGEALRKPRLLSTERFDLEAPQSRARQKEFRDHAKILIDGFNMHRKDFSRVVTRGA